MERVKHRVVDLDTDDWVDVLAESSQDAAEWWAEHHSDTRSNEWALAVRSPDGEWREYHVERVTYFTATDGGTRKAPEGHR